ncbi:hypothetical protein [Pelagerythrobacter aerophilus]|uniref:Nucleotidyltransferase family protein n=1 Tax=Pelagerythrobacter aerophilus TaxID=2306995 RepID=A0A418NM20_9SPHN|nr:hypothetical protein [Pelagerythrobacter aerophilus]RIV81241.1 hypothetical protein D2V04_01110 [Pelagerythrobacter aerophilus]
MSESLYRPEFEAALRLLAQVSEAMVARGLRRPILVGGAAAEFYSQSAISTGDFDLCTLRQPELEEEMMKLGFVRPSGTGQMLKGWIHPDLKLGFEVVADTPLDGAADPATLVLVENTGAGAFVVISVEDLIADRMGQYASRSAPDRLAQARTLFALQSSLDRAYLDRRIREETGGDYGIEALEHG